MPDPFADPALFPFPDPPGRGQAIEVAPGVLWLRFALPFRLDHVNVYLVADHDGWLLIDTGVDDAATIAAWLGLIEADADGPLRGRPITRIVATHHHPDHVGAAAALCSRTGARLLMGDTEFLTATLLVTGDATAGAAMAAAFHKMHGLDPSRCEALGGHLARYRSLVPRVPDRVLTLRAGDRLRVGVRQLDVLDLPGHAPAQIALHDATANILFVADHVLTRITPNIGVSARSPDDDPLGRYLGSLPGLRTRVEDGGLVLPGHHLPFQHLHARTREIEGHHAERCAVIEQACTVAKGRTVAELLPILFPVALDEHQLWFAFGEVLAHLNYLGRLGRLEPRDSHGRRRWGTVNRASHGG